MIIRSSLAPAWPNQAGDIPTCGQQRIRGSRDLAAHALAAPAARVNGMDRTGSAGTIQGPVPRTVPRPRPCSRRPVRELLLLLASRSGGQPEPASCRGKLPMSMTTAATISSPAPRLPAHLAPNRRSGTVRCNRHVRRPYQRFQCAARAQSRKGHDLPGRRAVARKVGAAVYRACTGAPAAPLPWSGPCPNPIAAGPYGRGILSRVGGFRSWHRPVSRGVRGDNEGPPLASCSGVPVVCGAGDAMTEVRSCSIRVSRRSISASVISRGAPRPAGWVGLRPLGDEAGGYLRGDDRQREQAD